MGVECLSPFRLALLRQRQRELSPAREAVIVEWRRDRGEKVREGGRAKSTREGECVCVSV